LVRCFVRGCLLLVRGGGVATLVTWRLARVRSARALQGWTRGSSGVLGVSAGVGRDTGGGHSRAGEYTPSAEQRGWEGPITIHLSHNPCFTRALIPPRLFGGDFHGERQLGRGLNLRRARVLDRGRRRTRGMGLVRGIMECAEVKARGVGATKEGGGPGLAITLHLLCVSHPRLKAAIMAKCANCFIVRPETFSRRRKYPKAAARARVRGTNAACVDAAGAETMSAWCRFWCRCGVQELPFLLFLGQKESGAFIGSRRALCMLDRYDLPYLGCR